MLRRLASSTTGFRAPAGLNRWVTITAIPMPALSPTMTQGTITEWKKKVGDPVAPGQQWCSVETDKAAVAFNNTSEEGFVARILVDAGTSAIPIGKTIALIVEEKADIDSPEVKNWVDPFSAAAPPAPAAAPAAPAAPPVAAAPKPVVDVADALSRSGPAVSRVVKSLPADTLSKVSPSGKDGRFVKSDFIAVGNISYENSSAVKSAATEAAAPTPAAASGAPASSSSSASTSSRIIPGVTYNFSVRDGEIIRKLAGKSLGKSEAPAVKAAPPAAAPTAKA